ncbi:MAG: hypothetical protein QNI99_11695 [Woeseiaceae bacterium]|nr:hypothetical protein [Woeseiaceae bacterium]
MRGTLLLLLATPAAAGMPEPEQANVVWTAEGQFCEPETVLPLPDYTLLVSNVCDFREAGTGYLTLLGADGEVIDWRVVDDLDAPLGMALVDGRIYIVDTNRIRVLAWPGFEQQSTIALETAVANDIAVSEDHTLYVTDTARGEVIVLTQDEESELLIGEARFPGANGIEIRGDDLYIGGERLWHVDLEDQTVTTIGPEWLADIDGIEFEADGTLQITPVGGPLIRLVEPVQVLGGDGVSSANHGYAPNLGLALIPTGFDNTVVAIRLEEQDSDQ